MRQDDVDADDQPDGRAVVGDRGGRRRRCRGCRSGPAASRHRLRDPGCGPDAAPAGDRQRRDRSGAQRPVAPGCAQGRLRRAGAGGTGRQIGRALPRAAVRRRTAARRRGTGIGGGSADSVDGRAVFRGGPDRALRVAARNPAPASRIAQDHRVRHARHRRGDPARRPRRGVRPRRGPTAVRRAGPAAVASGQRLRGQDDRRRPWLPLAAVP